MILKQLNLECYHNKGVVTLSYINGRHILQSVFVRDSSESFLQLKNLLEGNITDETFSFPDDITSTAGLRITFMYNKISYVYLNRVEKIDIQMFNGSNYIKGVNLGILKYIPSYTFNGNKLLEYIHLGKPDSMSTSWCGNKDITSVTEVEVTRGFNAKIYLSKFPNLTTESLHAIIENLADRTGQNALTFSVGDINIEKIDENHIAMLQNKNWNYS